MNITIKTKRVTAAEALDLVRNDDEDTKIFVQAAVANGCQMFLFQEDSNGEEWINAVITPGTAAKHFAEHAARN